MRTDTRKEAEARLHQVGPFIIRRGDRGRAPTYATKTGGWTTDRAKAWRFDTEKQAEFCLRGRGGEVVPADAEPLDQAAPRSVRLLPALAASVGPLTTGERKTLEDCEARIQKGLQSFLDVAAALLTVRAGLLYRQDYGTFEEYCRQRWGITPRRARQMCDGAEVVANLSEGASGSSPLPTNERQTRALQALPKPQQQLVWKEAVAAAPNGKPTSKHVQAAVQKRLPARNFTEMEVPAVWAKKFAGATPSSPDEVILVAFSRVKNGDIDRAYSAVELGGAPPCRIKQPFQHHGDLWCVGGGSIGLTCTQWEAYRLIPKAEYCGPDRRRFSYEGELVSWKNTLYRLGPKTVFRGDKSIQGDAFRFASLPQGLSLSPKSLAPADYSGAQRTKQGAAQTWDELPLAAKTVHQVDSPVGASMREAMAYLGAVDDDLEKSNDAVMQSNVHRALVLLRPVLQKYAGCDNMRAERLDKGQKPDPIVEARFHVIDAQVEAGAALQLLESQSGLGLTQEMYQAEKAVDHLNCLKGLLTNGGMRKPKGKG
ncbi:MAG TPA: hypothetical protein VHA37_04425 [Candidatus Saccharimonadales bacterium]|nr:hypothetical protein [Candidatus Saccharimonadales bacterium]